MTNKLSTNVKAETLTSLEVAELMERTHADVLKMLEGQYDKDGNVKVVGIIPTLKKGELPCSDFIIQDTYKQSGNGKSNKMYHCTKKGCDLLANKLTGEKGILFTAKYVERFHQMKDYIEEQQPKLPTTYKEALLALVDAEEVKEQLQLQNTQKDQIIGELKPKADYTDWILKNNGLVTITQIAKDYGMSGQAMNKLLHELGVQYNQSNQWLLYKKYHDKGYTHSETIDVERSDGTTTVKMITKWTQKGRLFIYELLKKERGLLPIIERKKEAS